MTETWRLLSGLPISDDEIKRIQLTAHNSQLSTLNRWEAAFNMAVDEAIVMAYRKGKVPPTLRLYTWRRSALTIGYFQSIQEELDWDACQRYRIPVVRRLTGGRAVLHGRDLTYSIVAGPSSLTFPTQTIQGVFFTTSRAFLRALNHLGLDAEALESPSKGLKTPLCFASSSWYEITCNGRKVIGSAQRRWRDVFLQQGSVLLEFKPIEFYRLFRFPTEDRRLKIIRMAGANVAGLNDCAERHLSFQELEEALMIGFKQALGVILKPGTLTPEEAENALHLTSEKYSRDDWNLNRAPL